MGTFNQNTITGVRFSSGNNIEKSFFNSKKIKSTADEVSLSLYENSHPISHHDKNNTSRTVKTHINTASKKRKQILYSRI